jgi:hypothetical protein
MLSDGGMSVLLTDVGESAWTLFWYKQSDSQGLTETESKRKMRALLNATQRLFDMC